MVVCRRLVLASASPRRSRLLSERGFRFDVRPADLDEEVFEGEDPRQAVLRLAGEKAMAVAVAVRQSRAVADDEVVLGADTTVLCVDKMLGKPTDPEDAMAMLMSLSGRNHQVATAWALVLQKRVVGSGITLSTVRMREISAREARVYAHSGEPDDKAGSYALQGDGRRFVAAVLGSSDNVIGLPVDQVAVALAALGVTPQC